MFVHADAARAGAGSPGGAVTVARATLAALLIALSAAAAGGADSVVRPMTPTVALTHVRVIDGSGAPSVPDRTIVVSAGHTVTIADAASVAVPADATVLDLRGRTVLPGLVGMHDHLFYQLEPSGSTVAVPAASTFARLYLAGGVTTIRTAGTIDFDGDADLKRAIDAGKQPGPKIHLTGPYLNATTEQPDPDGVAALVAKYADRGATSFKAYTSLRASELRAAIDAAHQRGLTVTGHLCAVGYREAAAFGIDNLEHGIAIDSDLAPGRQPDVCPNQWDAFGALVRLDPGDVELRTLIDTLVRRRIAVTSTLAVFESYALDESLVDPRLEPLLSSRIRQTFDSARQRRADRDTNGRSWWAAVLRQEMRFERNFVAAGGLLLAGSDPTGWGAIVAGYGDQRNLELLVSAGFTPEQAVQIGSANGAAFLNEQTIGRIVVGRQADLVVVNGDVSRDIGAIRRVELVFKDGVAYDAERLVASTAGTLGAFSVPWRYVWLIGILTAILVARRGYKIVAARTAPHCAKSA